MGKLGISLSDKPCYNCNHSIMNHFATFDDSCMDCDCKEFEDREKPVKDINSIKEICPRCYQEAETKSVKIIDVLDNEKWKVIKICQCGLINRVLGFYND